jgi:hypothetical protein
MKPFAILLILNFVGIFLTFAVAASGSGGETGMLPFIVLPYIGIISIILLIITSFFSVKTLIKSKGSLFYPAIILIINSIELLILKIF